MSQRNQDRLPRRERRAKERMAAKEAKRQNKATQERDWQGGSFAGFMGPSFQQNTLPLLALLAAIFVFYFPALSGEFVWDDVNFSEEKAVHAWSGLWSIWFAPSEISEAHYWPITYTVFWLEHKLFGLNPLGYHIVSCVLYFINIALIWRLLLKLEIPGAWAISAIFAIHPLHVESVAWLIGQKDLLSALFYLGAIHVWLRFRESSRLKTYALALSLYALGILSKSTVVTLPAALLILLWWKQERITAQDIMRLLPFFIVGFAITLGDYLFYVADAELDLAYSFVERVLIASQAVWFYVGKLLWPANLIAVYPYWDISTKNLIAWLFVATTAGGLILLWACRHRIGKGPLAGAAFFIITLSPTLGFVDYGYMQFSFVADRYQYLAGLGLMAVLMGGAIRVIQPHLTSLRPVILSAFAVLVIGLGALTWRQATTYQDELTFFSHIIAHNPNARSTYINLGNTLFKQQHYEEAVVAFQKAIDWDISPTLPSIDSEVMESIYRTLTHLPELSNQDELSELSPKMSPAPDKTGEAEHHLPSLQASQSGDSDHEVWRLLELQKMSTKQGETDKARAYLERVLKLAEGNPETMQSVADTLRGQEQYARAIEIYKEILAIERNFAMAYAGMGGALFRLERYEEAIESLARSIELHSTPPSATARLILMGHATSRLGRFWNAAQYYERAVELDPQNTSALEHLAAIRRERKRYENTLRLFPSARGSRLGIAPVHFNIGSALHSLGRLEEAARSFETALALDPSMEPVRPILKQLRKEIEEQK